jgi:hypothetical protein
MSNRTKFCLERLKGGDHLEDLGLDGRIILKFILGNCMGECGLASSASG